MTVHQFQQIHRLSEEKDLDEIDRAVQMVCIYTGRSPADIDRMSMKTFDRICARVAKVFEFKFNKKPPKFIMAGRKLYKVNYDAHLTAGRYVEGIQFGKDVIGNLHKILASVVHPINILGRGKYDATKHSKYAEDMLKVDFEKAYAIGVFFYHLYIELMRSSQPYIVHRAMVKGATKEEAEKMIISLQSVLDGLVLPSRSQKSSVLN